MAVQWFYKVGSQEIGPLTAQQLKQLADENRIARTDPVRRENDTQWVSAGSVKGLFPPKPAAEIPTGVAVPAGKPVVPVVSVVEPGKAEGIPVNIQVGKPSKKLDLPPVVPVSAPEKSGVDLGISLDGAASRSSIGKMGSKVPPRPAVGKNISGKPAAEAKPPLSPKELERKKFMLLVYSLGGVVGAAILILVLVYSGIFGASSKTAETEEAEKPATTETVAEAETESAPTDIFDTVDSGAKKADESVAKEEGSPDALAAKEGGDSEKSDAGDTAGVPEVEGYTNAQKFAAKRGDVRIRVRQATVDTASGFLGTRGGDTGQYLFIRLEITNMSDSKILDYPAWGVRSKTLSMKDNYANQYKPVSSQTLGTPIKGQQRTAMQVTGTISDILVFTAPVPKAEYLLLDLPSLEEGGTEKFQFLIPKEMFRAAPKAKKIPKAPKAEAGDAAENGEAEEEITDSGIEQSDLKVHRTDELSQSLDEVQAESEAVEATPAESAPAESAPAEAEAEEDDGLDEETREMRKMMRENGLEDSGEEEGPELDVKLSPELQAAEKEFNRQAEEERKAKLRDRNKKKK
ncbi:MAG: DUF4339 domain-containing protein [Planctomycetia bacterium]|nr:DUF4339 domain-containing protein [Planctomycetia bacterium]